jgi:hypothetical protein
VASEVDLAGEPRVANGAIDLGAKEHQPEAGFPVPVPIRVEAREVPNPFEPLDLFDPLQMLDPSEPLRVAVLSSESLDAPATLDPASLRLAGYASVSCSTEDSNDDVYVDLVCVFPFEAIDELPRLVTKRFCLEGETYEGARIRGCDRVGLSYAREFPPASVP